MTSSSAIAGRLRCRVG